MRHQRNYYQRRGHIELYGEQCVGQVRAGTQAKALEGVKSVDSGLSVVDGSKAEAKHWHDGREDRAGSHR